MRPSEYIRANLDKVLQILVDALIGAPLVQSVGVVRQFDGAEVSLLAGSARIPVIAALNEPLYEQLRDLTRAGSFTDAA